VGHGDWGPPLAPGAHTFRAFAATPALRPYNIIAEPSTTALFAQRVLVVDNESQKRPGLGPAVLAQ